MRIYCQPRPVPRWYAVCAARCLPAGTVIRRLCHYENWKRLYWKVESVSTGDLKF